MTITLYKNISDNIVVDKTLFLIDECDGNFRDNQSLINPVILIDMTALEHEDDVQYDNTDIEYDNEDISITTTFELNDTNYCYIKEFERYYFINDIEVYNNQLVILSCHVDVLMSYKDIFRNLNALVSRNEYDYDDTIEDEKLPFKYYVNINEYVINNVGEINFDGEDGNYAITYLNDLRNGSIQYENSPETYLGEISSFNTGTNAFAHTGIIGRWEVDTIAHRLYADESQLSFIISLIAFPFTIPGVDNHFTDLKLGGTTYNDIKVYSFDDIPNREFGKYYKIAQFHVDTYAGFDRGFLAYEPYCKYEIYLPYYGYTDLKYSEIVDSLINIYYAFDFKTGNTRIIIYNHTKDYIVKTLNAVIGVKISINRNNQQQLDDQRTSLAIKSTIASVGSIASIGVGAYTGNAFMVASGVTGLTNTVADIGNKLQMMHESANVSSNGGVDANYSCTDVKLKITKMVKNEPTNYSKYYGKPLNQTKLLSTLSGYTEIKDIRLDNFNGTNNEKNELISLLTSGIIL